MATAKSTTSKAPKSAPAAPATVAPQGAKVGVVESDKRTKTRKVVLSYVDMHPKYGKYIKKRTVLHVHDENNESRTGDVVEVAQCRKLSKTKSWRLVRVVEKRSEQAAAIASAREVV